jgi:hypothetical protein
MYFKIYFKIISCHRVFILKTNTTFFKKAQFEPGVAAYSYNLSTWKGQDDQKFKVSLSYKTRLSPKYCFGLLGMGRCSARVFF